MNLTPNERERLAYISGNTATAALLGELLDAEEQQNVLTKAEERIEELEITLNAIIDTIEKARVMISLGRFNGDALETIHAIAESALEATR